jgi:hypothetical protein
MVAGNARATGGPTSNFDLYPRAGRSLAHGDPARSRDPDVPRAAVAAAFAFWVATLLGAHHAIYALVGAVIVTDLNPATTRRLAFQRMGGTLIGAVGGAVFIQFAPSGPIALGVAIGLSMATAYACRLKASAAKVAGYVAAISIFANRDEVCLCVRPRVGNGGGDRLGAVGGVGAALVARQARVTREMFTGEISVATRNTSATESRRMHRMHLLRAA